LLKVEGADQQGVEDWEAGDGNAQQQQAVPA
jgi:hypothetical protein